MKLSEERLVIDRDLSQSIQVVTYSVDVSYSIPTYIEGNIPFMFDYLVESSCSYQSTKKLYGMGVKDTINGDFQGSIPQTKTFYAKGSNRGKGRSSEKGR